LPGAVLQCGVLANLYEQHRSVHVIAVIESCCQPTFTAAKTSRECMLPRAVLQFNGVASLQTCMKSMCPKVLTAVSCCQLALFIRNDQQEMQFALNRATRN